MKTYNVEFTATVEVEAKNEEEAYEKAYEIFDFDKENFYAYVNGESSN